MKKRTPVGILLFPLLLLYGALIGVPILGVLVKSLTRNRTLDFEILRPGDLAQTHWTLDNYHRVFSTPYYVTATINTVLIAGAAVLVAALVGTPIAFLLSRPDLPGRRVWEWVISLPIYLSGVLASYALLLFMSRRGLLAAVTEALFGQPLLLLGTVGAVIAGTVYIVLPMFIRIARAGFLSIRSEVYEAALTLGANETRTFLQVMLPQALPAIGAAIAVTFTYAMSLVVVILILGSGGATFTILPLEVLSVARSTSLDIPLASAMAIILLLVAVFGQFIAELTLRRVEGGVEPVA